MNDDVKSVLSGEFPPELVDALLTAFIEIRENFSLGRFRPSELEAGRFSEIVFRMLESKTTPGGSYTSLNTPLASVETISKQLESLDISFHDSIRLHIPRVLRSIYNIRNRRDVGHVSGDVNPNLADASLLLANANWVMAELIRLYFNCPVAQAQALVDALVSRRVPVIQDFSGHLKTLNPSLSLRERILLLLFHRGEIGASRTEMGQWLKGKAPSYISSELAKLEKEDFIHRDGSRLFITRRGEMYTEENIPFESTIERPRPRPRTRRRVAKRN